MHIVVIDNKKHRHSWHKDQLDQLIGDNIHERYESFNKDQITNCNADYVLVHVNNTKEFSRIESDAECGKNRIYFSGGYRKYYKSTKNDHYVPIKQLYEILKSLIDDSMSINQIV